MATKNYTARNGVVSDSADAKQKNTASQQMLVQRALARWKRGKGGINTQKRLLKAGIKVGNPPKPQKKQPKRFY
jgi:hypothetical protein